MFTPWGFGKLTTYITTFPQLYPNLDPPVSVPLQERVGVTMTVNGPLDKDEVRWEGEMGVGSQVIESFTVVVSRWSLLPVRSF